MAGPPWVPPYPSDPAQPPWIAAPEWHLLDNGGRARPPALQCAMREKVTPNDGNHLIEMDREWGEGDDY
jgi:hypothetical protein